MQRLIQKTTPKRALINGAMKTIHLTLVALLFTLAGHATVITVDNNRNSPADYTDLQTAVDSSNSGDTLYVHGSTQGYGDVDIDRQLTIIGTGYNPDNQWGLKTEVSRVYLKDGSDSTHIIGINFEVINDQSQNIGVKKVYIGRCYISGFVGTSINMTTGTDSWLIENNVILGEVYIGGAGGATNIIITNNLFRGDAKIVNASNPSVLVSNNTFHNAASSVVNDFCEYMNFRNNILINCDANSPSGNPDCANCTFENNITTKNQAFVFGNRTGSNNMVDTSASLVDISGSTFDNDYTPTPSSPAINAGTDGTDIGITGGTSPTDVHSTNMPAIPQVIEMRIHDMNIPINDSLKIQIRARDQE